MEFLKKLYKELSDLFDGENDKEEASAPIKGKPGRPKKVVEDEDDEDAKVNENLDDDDEEVKKPAPKKKATKPKTPATAPAATPPTTTPPQWRYGRSSL